MKAMTIMIPWLFMEAILIFETWAFLFTLIFYVNTEVDSKLRWQIFGFWSDFCFAVVSHIVWELSFCSQTVRFTPQRIGKIRSKVQTSVTIVPYFYNICHHGFLLQFIFVLSISFCALRDRFTVYAPSTSMGTSARTNLCPEGKTNR